MRKTRTQLSDRLCRRDSHVSRDFHCFLWSITFVLWNWLERLASLVSSVFFLTPSSDPWPSSSQPVYGESPVSSTVGTISEASTGNGYYYYIYIDICIYILRRIKRQALHREPNIAKVPQACSHNEEKLCSLTASGITLGLVMVDPRAPVRDLDSLILNPLRSLSTALSAFRLPGRYRTRNHVPPGLPDSGCLPGRV